MGIVLDGIQVVPRWMPAAITLWYLDSRPRSDYCKEARLPVKLGATDHTKELEDEHTCTYISKSFSPHLLLSFAYKDIFETICSTAWRYAWRITAPLTCEETY